MKVILKNLLVSLLLLIFMVVVLGLFFNILPEVIRRPSTWEVIGFAALPLTALLAICDYTEGK